MSKGKPKIGLNFSPRIQKAGISRDQFYGYVLNQGAKSTDEVLNLHAARNKARALKTGSDVSISSTKIPEVGHKNLTENEMLEAIGDNLDRAAGYTKQVKQTIVAQRSRIQELEEENAALKGRMETISKAISL